MIEFTDGGRLVAEHTPTMGTDASGTLEQHTGYYPYGEPWREPTGQPYLYGGKERMRDGALNDYDFTAFNKKRMRLKAHSELME